MLGGEDFEDPEANLELGILLELFAQKLDEKVVQADDELVKCALRHALVGRQKAREGFTRVGYFSGEPTHRQTGFPIVRSLHYRQREIRK